LIVLGVIYMTVLGGGGFFGLYQLPLRVASLFMLTLAVAIWLIVAWQRPFWRPKTSLGLALALSLAALAIALVFSERPRLGADYLAYSVLLAGGYLLLQRLFAHAFFGPRLGALGVLLGYALGVVFVFRVASHWLDFWAFVGRLTVPPLRPNFEGLAYGHPGTFATVMVLLWLASVAHLGLSTTRARLVIGVLGLLVAFVVVVTSARGAWLGVAVSSAIVVVLWLLSPERRASVSELLGSRRVRLGLIGLAAGFALFAFILLPAIARRITAGGEDLRAAFYAAAVRMFQDDPSTGLGPGMWVVERARHTLSTEEDYYIPHAHNLYLQTAAELGIVGVLAGIVVVLSLGRLVWLAVRSSEPLTQRLGWTSLFAMVYLGVHQLVDFYPNMAATSFLFALLVARLDALLPVDAPWRGIRLAVLPRQHAGRLTLVALAISTTAGTGWLLWSERAAFNGQLATDSANAGDWSAALGAARRAVAEDPDLPPYLFTQGIAAAHEGRLPEARDALRRSAGIDDYPIAWVNLAQVELELGNHVAARAALDRAMRLGFQNPQVAYGAMTLYEHLDDREAAVSAAADALVAAPTLASDPAWGMTELATLFDAAVPLALDRAEPSVGYLIAMEAGRVEDALRLAASLPMDDRSVAQAAVQAWNGDRAAFEELHRLASANSLDNVDVAICRRVAERSHEPDWPYDWTGECTGTGPFRYPAIRVGSPAAGLAYLPGPNATWHFQFVYRRFAPNDEVVPGLPHLRSF
jgi:O-antigen ligase